jgi:hypothetical protein
MTDPGTTQHLDAALAAAGWRLSDEERDRLTSQYEAMIEGVNALYAVEETRYEYSALVFGADPPLASWEQSDGDEAVS